MNGRVAKLLVFIAAIGIGTGVVFVSRFDFVSDEDILNAASSVTASTLGSGDTPPALIDPHEFYEVDDLDYQPTPTGVYFPINKKKFERDFALVMDFSEDASGGSMKIGDEFIESDLSLVGPRSVLMRTKIKSGIQYEFRGNFIKNGFEEWLESGESVLAGTLTKYSGERKVYSLSSKYVYTNEVCAWREENQ